MAWRTRPTCEAYSGCDDNPPVLTVWPPDYNGFAPNATVGQPMMPVPSAMLAPVTVSGKYPAHMDPQTGAFVRDFVIPPGVIPACAPYGGQTFYVPASAPEGKIGAFVIGQSPIGHRRPTHLTFRDLPPGPGEPPDETVLP